MGAGKGIRRTIAALAAACALGLAGAASAQAQSPVDVLVFHGPPDATTTAGVGAITAIGAANDFDVVATGDATQISTANLAGYRAVVFLNTAGDHLDDTQEAALEDYVRGGGGFVGIGSTAQGEPDSEFFTTLIGARPSGQSSTATAEQAVVAGDRVHPATRDLPLVWNRSDVWYQWSPRPTGTVHTVIRWRPPTAGTGDGISDHSPDQPISWCKDVGGGRSFYMGMGRTADAYGEDRLRTHLLGAIQWSAGLIRGNCKAGLDSSYTATRLVQAGPTSTGLQYTGESHGLVTAPNGWVIYIGRGDCRTDAERGALVGLPELPRILDHSNPNVGLGCGTVHVWDPEAYEGTTNSGVTHAGTLAVYGDGGTSGERTSEGDHKLEWGLLGIALAPDFMDTGHLYLQYFPSFNPETSPPGLGIERRISKISRPRISRFTLDLDTKVLDLDSEVRIFEYDAQVYSCCHVGGGMGFDSTGNLYVTTGDTNSSQGTDGYSGNNPDAKCPIGSNTVPSSAHCGTANFSYQDARRTAGNTNDYNGKMLRIRPVPDLPDGSSPPVGVGSTYTIPGAGAPNGPNLFSGTEGGGGKTKPEIYAMGLRNPSRLSIDPLTDIPYSAWVGPDAGSSRVDLGPTTYENAAQISHAGNYGWPYCMGNAQAYRDRVPGNVVRTDSPPGYVRGGPAGAPTEGWYDCNNLRNDSPNNTGLVELPHVTGTNMDAGKVRPNNFWWGRGVGGQAALNGCPEYPREHGPTNAPNYAGLAKELCPFAEARGSTIMNGPVYRYDDDATDNSRRWPAYWDGRWFLHNNGGASAKHGVLLDPATDQDGGQPVWADSLRSSLNWAGSYMDSKFGPDGALYVQVYHGFFRAGVDAGIYRYDYTGGPDTPFANPTATALGANQVRFSSAGSGGVSYRWEFGDGSPASTEANPTHTYPVPGTYTARLTVTYADGGESVKSIPVQALAAPDQTAPVTTATLNPALPGPGGTYNRPVTVALAATDQGGTGVARTEYRVDGGPFRGYSQPIRVTSNGEHTIDYRSTDGAGNTEATKSVSFTIALDDACPVNLSDEFNGDTLNAKWGDPLRPDPSALSVSGGRLRLTVRGGDMIGNVATAKNVLLQQAPPPGETWAATTKVDISDLVGDGGQQTGLVVWQRENPNHFAKIVFIHKPDGSEWFEYVLTTNNTTVRLPNSGAIANLPDEVYLRVVSDGESTLIPQYSVDGESWTQIGEPITELGVDVKVGLKISSAADAPNVARYDWFRVDCADRAAPRTTATMLAAPTGELAWHTAAPSVRLDATDGTAGTGIETTEYRLIGATTGEWRRYTGQPFTVTEQGRQIIEYHSIDTSGNEEPSHFLDVSVDTSAPTTTSAISPAEPENGTGPVTVRLDAAELGSGVDRTEYRVDGGPWRVYSAPAAERWLFDGSAESLAKWSQAPSGSFVLRPEDSSMETFGGLGMLYYTGEEEDRPTDPKDELFRDFSLKLQYREVRDTGWSNGGVFVRFPDPRIPLPQRPDEYEYRLADHLYEGTHCSRTNNANTQLAWVAINCGHEIQVHDDPGGGEPQKTGSIYNFRPNTIAQARPGPRGEWTNYEVRVEGQQYTILREGVIINSFNNAVPRNSSRGSDSPTQARQFAEGLIGLQNHGANDRIRYRNVRVTDLAPAARAGGGPFEVSGRGTHTVEFRSIDWAGNIEEKRAQTFRIGQPPLGSAPPHEVIPPSFGLARLARPTLAGLARRGLKVGVDCTGAMQGSAMLKVTRAVKRRLGLPSAMIARRSVRCATAGVKTITLKPSRKAARVLRRSRRAVRFTVEVRLAGAGQAAQEITRRLTLRR
jgi:PKD repeat protein/glucose/arabinose dehydrogenase/type 1 glutamine amidotransferase